MTTQIIQIKSHDIWANCLNVTSSDYLTYLGSMPAGCYISSYEKTDGDPKPTLDIGNNRIKFSASGKIWNILIKNSSNADLYFLYCCEGSGNDSLNRTVHNGLANNYTDHFLISSTGKWSRCQRDDVYRFGYSTKTNLSLLIENVTNGDFSTNLNGWTIGAETLATMSSGGVQIIKNGTSDNCPYIYQTISGLYRIFRYNITILTWRNSSSEPVPHILLANGTCYCVAPSYTWYGTHTEKYMYLFKLYSPYESWSNYDSYYNPSPAYFGVTNPTINLAHSNKTNGWSCKFDSVSLKVFEEGIKIPTLLTNRTKDCFGNTKTN